MRRANSETYVDFIIAQIKKGNVKYNEVLSLFCAKFRLTPRTFDTYWKKANTAYLEQREAIEKAKMQHTIELEKEAVKADLLNKL